MHKMCKASDCVAKKKERLACLVCRSGQQAAGWNEAARLLVPIYLSVVLFLPICGTTAYHSPPSTANGTHFGKHPQLCPEPLARKGVAAPHAIAEGCQCPLVSQPVHHRHSATMGAGFTQVGTGRGSRTVPTQNKPHPETGLFPEPARTVGATTSSPAAAGSLAG